MRSKKPLFIAIIFLCVWSFITYLLLMKQQTTITGYSTDIIDNNQRNQLLVNKVNYLETNIKLEDDKHNQLIEKLIALIKQKNNIVELEFNEENKVVVATTTKPSSSSSSSSSSWANFPLENKVLELVGNLESNNQIDELNGASIDKINSNNNNNNNIDEVVINTNRGNGAADGANVNNNVIENNKKTKQQQQTNNLDTKVISSDIKEIPLVNNNNNNDQDNNNNNPANSKLNEDIVSSNINNLSIIKQNSMMQQQQQQQHHDFKGPIIPIIVFACNRISVSQCLDNLIEYRPNPIQFPIIVSQDCDHEATRNVILSYNKDVILIRQPDQSDIIVPSSDKKFKGYYKISRHYGWALNTTFNEGFEFVILVEDDLNVAPDFYEYFLGTHELLRNDSSLWCVSAWNDNGKAAIIDENSPELLYRTDFFPGLGWMLTKRLWDELSVKWPIAFWDDWIRQPQQRKDRVCIRPEISRTRTFGKIGVSNGLFFEKHLRYIKLSEDFVHFTKQNMSYLLKENYDREFLRNVYQTPIIMYEELRRGMISTTGPVRIQYNTKDQYKRITKLLGLMDDFKSGVPRTAYHGIVSFFYNNQRVFLAPNSNWKGYDLSWS